MIAKRLMASVNMDAINGDQIERSVCASQMKEAAQAIQVLAAALQMAVRQNSHDMIMTGEEIRICEGAIHIATRKPQSSF